MRRTTEDSEGKFEESPKKEVDHRPIFAFYEKS